jgi:hypothetical protein
MGPFDISSDFLSGPTLRRRVGRVLLRVLPRVLHLAARIVIQGRRRRAACRCMPPHAAA